MTSQTIALNGGDQEDHWSSEAYQNSASFVPKLATKVVEWLDVKPDDNILDVGCGDGSLTVQIASTLMHGKGKIHGIDSSPDMIRAAYEAASTNHGNHSTSTFEVLDATKLISKPDLQQQQFDKVFSNAALHWILRPLSHREDVFRSIHNALRPSGIFVFEMGGMGNVAEMRTALLSVVSQRVGIEKAREVDPWFFPDQKWMRSMLEDRVGGWKVEKMELEYRPTRADEGGIEGWVRLMGKQFLDVIGREESKEREEATGEVCEGLKTVCGSESGGDWIGYVRLRAMVRKVGKLRKREEL